MNRTCEMCGGPLPPPKRVSGRPRRFCSDRCRKRQYDVACTDCGGRVDGTTPSKMSATPRCAPCRHKWEHDSRYWTPERIIEAIQRFAAEHGRQPGAADFLPALARKLGHHDRIHDGRWPHPSEVVAREFGSWNAAIEAAGFRPFDHARDHTWGPGRPIYKEAA